MIISISQRRPNGNDADIVPEFIKLEDWAYRQYLLGVLHSFIITGYRVRLYPRSHYDLD